MAVLKHEGAAGAMPPNQAQHPVCRDQRPWSLGRECGNAAQGPALWTDEGPAQLWVVCEGGHSHPVAFHLHAQWGRGGARPAPAEARAAALPGRQQAQGRIRRPLKGRAGPEHRRGEITVCVVGRRLPRSHSDTVKPERRLSPGEELNPWGGLPT